MATQAVRRQFTVTDMAVDLVTDAIERATDWQHGQYRLIGFANRGESLPSTVFPSLMIDVDTVIGT